MVADAMCSSSNCILAKQEGVQIKHANPTFWLQI